MKMIQIDCVAVIRKKPNISLQVLDSQFYHKTIHINMADWDLVQLLDLHNLLVKCGYYCNHSTSEIFFSYERRNEEGLGAFLRSGQLVYESAVCF